MSNQFRRLKLTHTLRHGLSTGRLAPFPDDAQSALDATMKARRKPNGTLPPSPGLGGKEVGSAWAAQTKDSGETERNYHTLDSRGPSGFYNVFFVFLISGHCRAATEKEDFLITTMVSLQEACRKRDN